MHNFLLKLGIKTLTHPELLPITAAVAVVAGTVYCVTKLRTCNETKNIQRINS